MDDLNGTNASDAAPVINSFYFYETEQFAVLWSLFTLIVVGNAAVLVTLLAGKRRKSRMNFFIVQLALADLSVGLISVLTDIVWRMTVAWNAGNAACKLIRFLQAVVTYSSTYVLVALSIDRYDAITHPMNFSGSWRRARLLVAAAWLLSAVFSVPIAVLYHERPVEGRLQCWIDFPQAWQWQLYMTLVALTLFALPAVIISACYTVIVSTIWSKGRHMAPPPPYTDARTGSCRPHQLLHQHSHSRLSSGKSRDDEADGRRASSRGIIPKAKVKTVKMTFVIVFMFVVCWSPYIVFDLLQVYGQVPRTQANIAVASFIQSLAPLNSAANPVVYCLFSRSASKAIRKVPPFRWLRSLCCPKAAAAAASPGEPPAPVAAHTSRRQPPPHWTTRRQTHRRYIGEGLPPPAVVSIV
nr:crustacean cardioactive peptide receptor isoform 1 [Schistocerca gregaria]